MPLDLIEYLSLTSSSRSQAPLGYSATFKSVTRKSTQSFSLFLKASAMMRAASLCSRPLRESPFTSRITWPTFSWPQLWAEPPLWEAETNYKFRTNLVGQQSTAQKNKLVEDQVVSNRIKKHVKFLHWSTTWISGSYHWSSLPFYIQNWTTVFHPASGSLHLWSQWWLDRSPFIFSAG